MKILLAICLGIGLTGCGTLQPFAAKGADVYDQLRLGAEFTLCRAISVGAWVRAYGGNVEKAQAWRAICQEPIAELPVQ
jgi:hypothetical protein